jgi:electron transfer flavoprotein beta subunit
MGAAEADAAVRRMLAMGADDGLLVCDDALREADVRATARVLAAAIQHTGVNLAVFGNESADGSSGTVPAAVAAVLDWPLLSLARVATLEATTIRCERDLAMGTELAETELPAIVSFVAGSVDPRYPTLNDVLGARARSVPQISLASLGVENVAPVS